MSENKNNQNNSTAEKKIGKAVPIILSLFAIFITICFITSKSGLLGQVITALLMGLFGRGAYVIPIALLLHAVCYKSDVAEKKVLSRAIFSLVSVVLMSAIDYAIYTFGTDGVFAPVSAFNDMINGGFVGNVIGFALSKLIGNIGVIIISLVIIAIYAVFYYAEKAGAAGQVAIKVSNRAKKIADKAKDKHKESVEKKAQKREEEEQLKREASSQELMNDDFFEDDKKLSSVKIKSPGEKNNTSSSVATEVDEKKPVTPRNANKPIDLSYGIDNSTKKKPEDVPYSKAFFGLDDSADNVFTKDFDPFDFASSERSAAKHASRVSAPSTVQEELDEFAIYEMKANHMPTEKEKKMADLERRRQEWFRYKHQKDLENDPVAAAAEAKRKEEEALNISTRPLFDSFSDPAIKTNNSSYSYADSPAPFHSPTGGYGRPAPAPQRPVSTAPSTTMEFGGAPVSQPAPTPAAVPVASAPATAPASPAPSVTPVPTSIRPSTDATHTSYNNTRSLYQRPIKTVEFTITKEPKPEPAVVAPPVEEKPAPHEDNTEDVAILIAERIARNTPGYLRSANEMKTYTKVTSSSSDDELLKALRGDLQETPVVTEPTINEPPVVESAPEMTPEFTQPEPTMPESPAPMEFSFGEPEVKNVQPTPQAEVSFQPYSPLKSEEALPTENTIKVEKNIIPPTPDAVAEVHIEPVKSESQVGIPLFDLVDEKESLQQDSTDEGNIQWDNDNEPNEEFVFDEEEHEEIAFDDEEDDDDSDDGSEDPDENPEDETEEPTEIPPEEQNPDVVKMREMFPFLANLDATKEPVQEEKKEPEAQKEDDVDDVPFFEPVVKKDAPAPKSTELVPAKEKKNKPDYSNYVFPSIDLLSREESAYDDNIQAEIQENADKLIETLASFNVTASIKGVDRGPRITRYEVVPAKGVKVSQIMNLQDDIALNLAAGSIRMEAPIPGKSAVGIEIPNKKSNIVRLRNLLETEDFQGSRSKTFVCIGRDVAGQPVFGDIAKMPHLLIAGATGMGKSVCINSLLISVLYKARPDEVKLIMIDPKQVEFTMYNGIPHLLVPVVSDPKQAAGSLMWAVEEMERRYNLLNPLCVRNIDAYNEKVTADPSLGEPMPRIIIVIDEFADLMLQVKDPVETLVMRIAQKARAAGIYLVIGTQRPSVNVITGVIKANVPSRISCKVMSNVDSKTVLDSAGAEKLLDRGDALYAPAGSPKPHRVQCAFVSDGEVEAVMQHLRQFSGDANYDSTVMEEIERAAQKCSKKGGSNSDYDESDHEDMSGGEGYLNNRQFLDAVEIAVNTRKISTSLIQRKLSIGYGKAAKFIDVMEDMGIVGEANGQRPREVLLTPDEWREKQARASLD